MNQIFAARLIILFGDFGVGTGALFNVVGFLSVSVSLFGMVWGVFCRLKAMSP